MKAPYRYILFIFLITLSAQGLSQIATEENVILQQITLLEKGLLSTKYNETNILTTGQQGVSNLVFIGQASNAVVTNQSGWFNLIFLQQATSNSSIKVMQTGRANQYEGKIAGNEIDILITQQGELNIIEQSIIGQQLEFTISQEGNRNTIQHRADRSVIPLQIHQTGSDMRLIIKSGN